MLDYLHIENVAVIKKLDINFKDGFNVLTGETGAGKSIIIDSINMLLGAKASKDFIRHGEERAVVSAYFSCVNNSVYAACDELGISYDRDDSFSIFRSITADGKSTIKINSAPATLTQLKTVGPMLINIHGQNENQSFMNKANHLRLLDEYAGIDTMLEECAKIYSKLQSVKAEINAILESNKQKETMVDILKYQIKEIDSAKLKDTSEEEKLVSLRNKLKGAEKIVKNATTVYKALMQNESGISAIVLIEKAMDALNRLSDVDPEFSEMAEKLSSYKYEIEDVAERAREYLSFDGIDNPQMQLDKVEDRLTLIQRLEKKYGADIQSVLAFRQEAQEKLTAYETSEVKLDDLKEEYKALYANGCDIALNLHKLREKASCELGEIVEKTLVFLDMPKVKFKIKVDLLEKNGKQALDSHGSDNVEFYISTNAGEELTPMNKIASGGELARIMLALKSAMSDKNGAETIIYDEIDTGVSGSTSQKIGIKLAEIARNTQSFCVTHSAQIAALAENHYFIKKNEVDGRAETSIYLLNEEEKVQEIARIISGMDLTEKQVDAAEILIAQSKEILKSL